MGLEGQAHLEDAVSQQDQAHGANQRENEIRQIFHDGQGIVGGEGGNDQSGHGQQEAGGEGVEPLGTAFKFDLLPGQGRLEGFGILHNQSSPFLLQKFRLPGQTAVCLGASF